MGAFGGFMLTHAGRNLQAKVQAGTALKYTRVGVGDGELGSQSPVELKQLISEKKSLEITRVKRQGQGKATISAVLSNQSMTTGFYFREFGVYAEDPDVGEMLYCYTNAGHNAEYIPAGGGPDVIEKQMDAIVVVGNASDVKAEMDTSLVWVTRDEFTAGVEEKVSQAEASAKLHADEKVSQAKEEIGEKTARLLSAKMDRVNGKQLSSEDYTSAEKKKLDGITINANKYVHPDTHSATMISEDSTHRFVTDVEKAKWNQVDKKIADSNAAKKSDLDQHVADKVTHITATERTTWNAIEANVKSHVANGWKQKHAVTSDDGTGIYFSEKDVNTLTTTGYYGVYKPMNAPATSEDSVVYLEVHSYLDHTVMQKLYDSRANKAYQRRMIEGAWTPWEAFITERDIETVKADVAKRKQKHKLCEDDGRMIHKDHIDLNNLRTTGFYTVFAATNAPPTQTGHAFVTVLASDSGNVLQTACDYMGLKMYVRSVNSGGSWTPWVAYVMATDLEAVKKSVTAMKAPPTWITPTLLGGSAWSEQTTAAYSKDIAGVVHVKGFVTENPRTRGAWEGIDLFRLPKGHRPQEITYFCVFSQLNDDDGDDVARWPMRSEVHPDGRVRISRVRVGHLYRLEQISFLAER